MTNVEARSSIDIKKVNIDADGHFFADREKLGSKPLRQFHDLQRNIHRLIAIIFVFGNRTDK